MARFPRWLRLWAPVVFYMAVVFVVSAQPSLPTPPARLSDKHWHFMEYAGLSALASRAVGGGFGSVGAGAALGGWAIASAYGVTDEVHQAFVPGRDSDVLDVLADTTGAAAAAVSLWAWGIIIRSRRERRSVAPPA
jgi:VanZ family protein